MISRIKLKHFKCFDTLSLPLAPLTLLSGKNASGKSSVLQSLVLLHQTMREHEWSNHLMLNGNTIRLGTVTDVVDRVGGRFSFDISIIDQDTAYSWSFSGDRSDMSMMVNSVTLGDNIYDHHHSLRYLLPYITPLSSSPSLAAKLRDLVYITAERQGPREVYPLEDNHNASVVGPTGEYTASVLHLGRDEKVTADNLLSADAPPTLLRQVEAQMNKFFPGCGLIVVQVPQTNSVTLGLRTSPDSEYYRPIHVGFGLTQVLPIVVAALSAKPGSILLIENPEVHLHPAGQAFMGQFLADVAQAGIQVIIETHSDHVLNGIRRSVRAQKIDADNIVLHFFSPRSSSNSQIESPQIDSSGNIDSWPQGFFDQFDKDSNYFAGWGE